MITPIINALRPAAKATVPVIGYVCVVYIGGVAFWLGRETVGVYKDGFKEIRARRQIRRAEKALDRIEETIDVMVAQGLLHRVPQLPPIVDPSIA